jgi:hypothetical protein
VYLKSRKIKGRTPSAIESLQKISCDEKNDYYERCAFVVEIPEISEVINGNKLNLSYGVRSPTN